MHEGEPPALACLREEMATRDAEEFAKIAAHMVLPRKDKENSNKRCKTTLVFSPSIFELIAADALETIPDFIDKALLDTENS